MTPNAPTPGAARDASSPYDAPDLYDLLFESLDFDVAGILEHARAAKGPVLEVGCGTGRVLLRLRAAGLDADGLEPSSPMLKQLQDKAAVRGLTVNATLGDARDFALPRRYAMVMWVFNGFSHMLTLADQLAALRCMRAHLAPGGALLIHQSQLAANVWVQPEGQRVLEHEADIPGTDRRIRIFDTRTTNRSLQTQQSIVEIEELDAGGAPLRTHRSETTHRWTMRNELELLLIHAGFALVDVRGDDGHGPVTPATQQMWAFAWKE